MLKNHQSPKWEVIYVDVNEKSRRYFELSFRSHFHIKTFSHSQTARHYLETNKNKIAVLLTNHQIPAVNSFELIDAKDQETSVILIFSEINLEVLNDTLISSMINGVLLKPWKNNCLFDQIARGIDLFEQQVKARDLLQAKKELVLENTNYIAHEMRTPLLSIKLAANNIINQLNLIDSNNKESVQRSCNLINKTIYRTDSFIDILLKNANSSLNSKLEAEILYASDVLENAMEMFPFSADQKQKVDIVKNENFPLLGSKVLFPYIIVNLLKNAFEAINNKGEGLIQISLVTQQQFNQIIVKDTGIGIAEEHLEIIFDNFISSPGQDRKQGFGIGLSFCKDILESFKANIQCHSLIGEYTEFVIAFPKIELNKSLRHQEGTGQIA